MHAYLRSYASIPEDGAKVNSAAKAQRPDPLPTEPLIPQFPRFQDFCTAVVSRERTFQISRLPPFPSSPGLPCAWFLLPLHESPVFNMLI